MTNHTTSPAGDLGFSRAVVVGGLLAIALLFAATTLRGLGAQGAPAHDDRPVQLDR